MKQIFTKSKFYSIAIIALLMETSGNCQSLGVTNTSVTSGSHGGELIHNSDNTVLKMIHTVSLNGTPGRVIGKYMDKQAKELKSQLKDARVERVGECILVTFDGSNLFGPDSFELEHGCKSNLKSMARSLKQYSDTNTWVACHTDDTAEDSYNLIISDKRAREVETFLVKQGVNNTRIKSKGYGETQPLVPNDSENAKKMNRRIEIVIYASDEMRALALRGDLGDYLASKK